MRPLTPRKLKKLPFSSLFIERKSKQNLHAITVILPQKLKKKAYALLSTGNELNDKRIPPYSVLEPEGEHFPKRIPIHFRILPCFLHSEEVFKCSNSQRFEVMPNIQHQKRQLPNEDMLFFTGEAKATVIIHNEHEEQRLKAWAIGSFKLIRNCQGATFKVFALTMLECVNCKSSNLHFCHHPSQCKLNCHQKSLQTEIPDPNA